MLIIGKNPDVMRKTGRIFSNLPVDGWLKNFSGHPEINRVLKTLWGKLKTGEKIFAYKKALLSPASNKKIQESRTSHLNIKMRFTVLQEIPVPLQNI